MIVSRTSQTAAFVRARKAMGQAARRRRLPRQHPPDLIKAAYARELVPRVVRAAHAALHDFAVEIPRILASNALALRHDGYRADAGESKRISDLIEFARGRMRTAILTPDLDRLAKEFAAQTSTYQRTQLLRQTRAALGVDVFINDAKLAGRVDAFVANNVGLIRGLTDEFANKVEKGALAAVQGGVLYDDYADTLQKQFGFPEARATLIARDQIGKLYGQTNKERQQELGIRKFVWRSSGDERVRALHDELDGNTYSYDDLPVSGTNGERLAPGEPIECRCTAEPDFSGILGQLDDSAE